MADTNHGTWAKDGVQRVADRPHDAVKFAADGWRRVDPAVPAPAKNASGEQWRDYAAAQGVDVPDEAGRGDVIAAVQDAGILPTE